MMGMPACKEVAQFVASDELTRQPWHKRLGVRMHLLMCRHCRAYAEQMRAIGRSVRDLYANSGAEARVDELLEILKRK